MQTSKTCQACDSCAACMYVSAVCFTVMKSCVTDNVMSTFLQEATVHCSNKLG